MVKQANVSALTTFREHLFQTKSGEIERRWLRCVLDVLATCENLALMAVFADKSGRTLERATSSHQNPFIEMCRTSPTFLEEEDTLILSALNSSKANDNSVITTKSYTSLSKKYQGALVGTNIENLYIFAGPVSVRPGLYGEPLKNKKTRDDILENISQIFKSDILKNGPLEFSKTRAARLIWQRAPISSSDLTARLSNVNAAFNALINSTVELKEIDADIIEAYSKSVAFSVTVRNRSRANCYALSPTSVQSEYFPLGEIVPSLCVDKNGEASVQSLSAREHHVHEWRARDSLLWSRYCDSFRTTRNSFHLEQVLVTRLWTQDTFSGTTIESEDGGEKSSDFGEFASRILNMCAADGCVIYRFHPGQATEPGEDARFGFLQPLGRWYAYPDLEMHFASEEAHIKEIAVSSKAREESICYRCVDSGSTQFLPVVSDGDVSSAGRTPRSVLVAPLISRGRLWGAVEVLGVLRGQLHRHCPRWVEEIVRVATPIFYNQWMLYHFREMSMTVATEEPSDQKYSSVLDHVRKLFLASSARLYIQHPTRTSEFIRKAHSGVPFPDAYLESFSLTNSNSVSTQCIESGKSWQSGRIGESPFDEEVEDGIAGPLEASHHKAAAVIPIRGQDENCFATVFVTSLDDEEFPEEWLTIAQTVSLQLSVILEAIHLRDVQSAQDHAYYAHTIKTRAERVELGGDRLLEQLDPLFGDPKVYERLPDLIEVAQAAVRAQQKMSQSEQRYQDELWNALRSAFPRDRIEQSALISTIPKAMSDLKEHLKELHLSAVHITGGPNEESPEEAHPETWGGTPCSIRNAILESLKPISNRTGYRRSLTAPPLSVIDWGPKAYVPEQTLVEILNNLLDNALKYDFSPPSVSLSVRTGDGGENYTIRIANLAPRVTSEEAAKLKTGGVRANYALKKDRRGGGKGLSYSLKTSILWGLDLSYEAPIKPKLESEQSMGWHVLNLTIPNAAGRK